jgi:hypothetical protein
MSWIGRLVIGCLFLLSFASLMIAAIFFIEWLILHIPTL